MADELGEASNILLSRHAPSQKSPPSLDFYSSAVAIPADVNQSAVAASVTTSANSTSGTELSPDEEDGSLDRPLLEELGVDFHHLRVKAFVLLRPWSKQREDPSVPLDDADLAGPLFSALALGGALLLRGRIHFSHIYGGGVAGCLAIFALLNLMVSSRKKVDLAFVVSTLGYGLMPLVAYTLISLSRVLFNPPLLLSLIITALFVGWSTWAATERFVQSLQMTEQRWLIAYPVALVYAVFTIIAAL